MGGLPPSRHAAIVARTQSNSFLSLRSSLHVHCTCTCQTSLPEPLGWKEKTGSGDENSSVTWVKQSIRHFHISHNAPYLPLKIFHNLCFSFLLGITAVLREIENNAYTKFWGVGEEGEVRCIMGDVQVAYAT